MSVYDRQANGRGRHEESTFVGGSKIAKGPMTLWRNNAERQWLADGEPEEDLDPSHPYWVLQTYKTYVCARTVAGLERLIEAATYSGYAKGYWRDADKPKHLSRYQVSYYQKRAAKALDRVVERLQAVLGHIKRIQEEQGQTPYGMDCEGNFVGYRSMNESNKADEATAALMALEYMGGFGND